MVSFPTRMQNAAIAFGQDIPAQIVTGVVGGAIYGYLANTPIAKTMSLCIITSIAGSAIMKFAKNLTEDTRQKCLVVACVFPGFGYGTTILMRQQGIWGYKMTVIASCATVTGVFSLLYGAAMAKTKPNLVEQYIIARL